MMKTKGRKIKLKREYKIAFTEVCEIFKLMPKELLDKIPNKFIEILEDERDKEYYPNIKEPIEDCNLKDETIVLLGLIYRDFLCDVDERKRLQNKDYKEIKKIEDQLEKELKEKYNINIIFNKKNNIEEKLEQKEEEKSLTVIQEEKWYQKIFNIINRLFNKS